MRGEEQAGQMGVYPGQGGPATAVPHFVQDQVKVGSVVAITMVGRPWVAR